MVAVPNDDLIMALFAALPHSPRSVPPSRASWRVTSCRRFNTSFSSCLIPVRDTRTPTRSCSAPVTRRARRWRPMPVPLAGVTAPVSSGANPAAAEVSHIQTVNAQLTSQLPVPLSELHSAPLLANLQTPAEYDHYVTARTATWKTA